MSWVRRWEPSLSRPVLLSASASNRRLWRILCKVPTRTHGLPLTRQLRLLRMEATECTAQRAAFTNGLAVGEMSDITVAYDSGYTGATNPADVEDQTVTVTAEDNLRCNPGISASSQGWITDFNLTVEGWRNWGPGTSQAVPGLDGFALLITSLDGLPIETKVMQRDAVWNKQRNWWSANLGLGAASVGKTFKFSIWARLGSVPAAGTDVRLEVNLMPWSCDG